MNVLWLISLWMEPIDEGRESLDMLLMFLGIEIVQFLTYIGTLLRHRWARIGLMSFCVVAAVRALIDLSLETTSFLSVSFAFLSVFVVLGVSGDKTREWVSKEPKTSISERLALIRKNQSR